MDGPTNRVDKMLRDDVKMREKTCRPDGNKTETREKERGKKMNKMCPTLRHYAPNCYQAHQLDMMH